jgi:hypothetical protein
MRYSDSNYYQSTPIPLTSAAQTCALWDYQVHLLLQAGAMVERLQKEAQPGFRYAQAVGPHVRHILEHVTALTDALQRGSMMVDYDARERDLQVQSVPAATLAKIRAVVYQIGQLKVITSAALDLPLSTRLQTGPDGALEVVVQSTLGRELLFVASHTVHHFALLAQYCKAAGVDLGHDFGKAPATVAYERKAA